MESESESSSDASIIKMEGDRFDILISQRNRISVEVKLLS